MIKHASLCSILQIKELIDTTVYVGEVLQAIMKLRNYQAIESQ